MNKLLLIFYSLSIDVKFQKLNQFIKIQFLYSWYLNIDLILASYILIIILHPYK